MNDGLAPSERHLEDYLWEHPEALGLMGLPDYIGDGPIYDWRWRQVNMPSGRIDLMGIQYECELTVCELKLGPIDAKAFSQVMRYMRDVKRMASIAADHFIYDNRLEAQAIGEFAIANSPLDQVVRGLLIGSRLTDSNLLSACDAANIDVVTYEFGADGYQFFEHGSGRYAPDYNEAIWRALLGPTGALIRELIDKKWRECYLEPKNRRFSAVAAAEDYVNSSEEGDTK